MAQARDQTIFVSYTRTDETLVCALRDDLERLGRPVWMDHEVHGGELWWREIIQTIQAARVFVFALSEQSWKSQPCRLEFEYAQQLGIPVLPVQVGPLHNARISIMEIQIVDYRERDADAIVGLVAALAELTARPLVLPDPLPAPPTVPFEYLYRIAELLGPHEIPPARQEDLIGQLRRHLKNEQDEVARADIVKLLREFRERGEITKNNSREIDEILDSVGSAGPEPAEGGITRLPPTDHWRRAASESASPAEPQVSSAPVISRQPAPLPSETAAVPVQTPAPKPLPKPESAPVHSWRTPAGPAQATPVPTQGTAPAWLRTLVTGGGNEQGSTPTGSSPQVRQSPPTPQWWDEPKAAGPPPPPPPPSRIPQPAGDQLLAFMGTFLGAMGFPFLLLALVHGAGTGKLVVLTTLLIITGLGLSISIVSATRGESRSRLAIAISLAGLLSVIIYSAVAGFS